MVYLSRRDVLRGVASGLISTALARVLKPKFAFAASSSAAAGQERFLVVIKLGGGMDVLGAVPFIGNTAAAAKINARRSDISLSINPNTATYLDLGMQLAFHPSFEPLFQLYQAGMMKVIYGYGNPTYPLRGGANVDGSHEYHQSVQAFGDTVFNGLSNGWLARAMEVFQLTHQQVMGLGVPGGAEFRHSNPSYVPYAANSLNNLAYQPLLDQLGGVTETEKIITATKKIRQLHRGAHQGAAITEKIAVALDQMDQAVAFFRPINTYAGLQGSYTNSNLGGALKGIGKCIASFNGSGSNRIFFTSYNQAEWDTHQDQALQLASNIGDLSSNLAALISDLRTTLGGSVWNRTTIITTSEFGRRIYSNGKAGTDHGTGGAAIALGGSVRGVGRDKGLIINPSLANAAWNTLENVPVDVHFQNLFGESLEWLGLSRDLIYDPAKYDRVALNLLSA